MANSYVAPITLGFTPADRDRIHGTVNGVEVRGKWSGTGETGGVALKRVDDPDTTICAVGFLDGRTVVEVQSDSAPTTDYELHLYRYVPADIVQIPQVYVEGLGEAAANATEAKTAAETAQSTANAAKTAAETAQSTANAAKTTAETAKSTANAAKTTAETAQSTANNAKTAAETAQSTANNAKTAAETAKSTANSAKTTAETAQSTANEAKTAAESIDMRGKTWTQSNITNMIFNTIVYANGLWVAGSKINDHGLYYSTDGKTWTQSNITNMIFDSIVYANDLWVAGSYSYSEFSNYGIYYSASKYALTDKVDAQLAEVKQSIDEIKSADVILPSSTAGSTKKFKITVDDAGVISTKEVTE